MEFSKLKPGVAQISRPDQPASYLDVGDNVHANVIGWLDSTCANEKQWFIPGQCENGHRYAKIIVCGKEWCAVCGRMGSMAHNRRYVRWLTKIMQFKSMRYLVFTIPEAERQKFRSKQSLTDLGRRCQEMLKRHGFSRGLRRWHWFGDRSHKWNPHLNVLIDGGYLDDKELKSIKNAWSRILGVKTVSVNISYKRTNADMAGCLHYVTRSTFLDYNWDIDMAMELHKFRNMVVWGRDRWNDQPAWDLPAVDRKAIAGEDLDVEAIENIIEKKCPICGGQLSWENALPAKLLDLADKESYGAGYYRMIDRPRPPDKSEELERRLRILELEKFGKIFIRIWDKKHSGFKEY